MNMNFDPTTGEAVEQPVQEQEAPAIPKQVLDHAPLVNAITTYQLWLSTREARSGPFGASWGTGEGEALVKQFCEEQGW